MIKELKYIFFLTSIFFFFFFIIKYFFSDQNIKNVYRSIDSIDSKIEKNENNLLLLKNDTNNIIEYVEKDLNSKKKKYFFWDLLKDD